MQPIRIILLILFFCFSAINYSQPNAERIKLEIVYQMGLITLPTGEIEFSSYTKYLKSKPLICMEANFKSEKNFEIFYKYNSYCQANIDIQNNQIKNFIRKVNQNGEVFEENYYFDTDRKLIYSNILQNDLSAKQDTLAFQKEIFDFLTAGNFIRHLKFESLKPGQRIPFNILIDKNLYSLYIKYLGVERVNLPNRNSYVCYKITLQVLEGNVFKGGEAITAWISADAKRLPIQCEAKILVGSVKATLADVEYPSNLELTLSSNKE